MVIKNGDLLKFPQKTYKYISSLGQGACGETILLYHSNLDKYFACKKFKPSVPKFNDKLLLNFIREAQIMFNLYHKNVVRVFDFYYFEKEKVAYIFMEYIEGINIQEYIYHNPSNINYIFEQAINGFLYLEENNILHRDVRPSNIMIQNDGNLKIIDFGFGKQNEEIKDTLSHNKKTFDSSIKMNWICSLPNELEENNEYDTRTEIYFLGQMFKQIINELKIDSCEYYNLVKKMCVENYHDRISSFKNIKEEFINKKIKLDFSYEEKQVFRIFENYLISLIAEVEVGISYNKVLDNIYSELNKVYKEEFLHTHIYNNAKIASIFCKGKIKVRNLNTENNLKIDSLKNFISLIEKSDLEKKNIILDNIYSRLNTIRTFDPEWDEIPF